MTGINLAASFMDSAFKLCDGCFFIAVFLADDPHEMIVKPLRLKML